MQEPLYYVIVGDDRPVIIKDKITWDEVSAIIKEYTGLGYTKFKIQQLFEFS